MTIKAIETRYAGCRFRSRLEARWAVFFDHLGIPWEYEPQGYELPSGRYLPDFWLPTVDAAGDPLGTWFEVKHDDADSFDNRWSELVCEARRPLIVSFGMPRPDGDVVWGCRRHDGFMEVFDPVDPDLMIDEAASSWDNGRAFCICPACGRVGIKFGGRWERLRCGHCPDWREGAHDPRILDAYAAARSARFEHGERG